VSRCLALSAAVCLLASGGFTAAAASAAPVRPAAAHCTAATYTPVHGVPSFHQRAVLIFTRHLNVGPHTAKKAITWSVPATRRLTAHVSTSGGAHGDSGWIWRRVTHHFGQRVASGGQQTPRTAKSGRTFAVRNHTPRTKRDIEFNGLTRFGGAYFTTRCADVNSHGVGRVVRHNGTWVTFGKVTSVGIAQCGAGSGGSATVKAALKHCK
jgi:hypothetical protein